jgi:nickel-dependent lactate racemase
MKFRNLELAFGHTHLPVRVPEVRLLGVLKPLDAGEQDSTDRAAEARLLRDALAHPSGTPPLRDLARAGQQVVIVTSDLTRPCPSERLLPPVLEELAAAGVPDEDILIVVALGLHRRMTPPELEALVGREVYARVRVVNHDVNDTVRLGVTRAGTPVEIFAPVVEADLRVCLGNLELHYFVGYSGGAKAIMPGCASRATVTANHALMVRPEAVAGRLAGNPVRADLEEGVAMLGVDFILNVLTDGEHNILEAVAGDVTQAHRRGCERVARRATVPVPRRADVVLVSAGGYPKDVNMYQAQKALDHAAHAVRDGGVIIWVAECSEGFGNATFETWLCETGSPAKIVARIQQGFVIGGHKAAAMATVLQRADVFLVSALPAGTARCAGLVPFADPNEALRATLQKVGGQDRAGVLVIPEGGSVLPQVSPGLYLG